MAHNADHDGKSKTSSAVDGEHYPDVETQEDHLLPGHSEIAVLAHQLWLEQGRPAHSAERDWFEAERRLTAERGPSLRQTQQGPQTHQGVTTSTGTVQR